MIEVSEIFISEMGQALCRMLFTDATLSITLLPKHKHLSYSWIKRSVTALCLMCLIA